MTLSSRLSAASDAMFGEGPRLERHLVILMASRLVLATASLVIGLALDAIGGNLTMREWHGFYATVAVAFVATLVYRPFVGRIERPRAFAAVNLATDIGLVSALVLFSGGGDSVFTFLYVVIAIYAAMLFKRWSALAFAGLAGAAYGLVLVAGQVGWVEIAGAPQNAAVLAATWAVHSGAVLLVSALASTLVFELERAGLALDQRTSDLASLQTLHERTVESLMSGLLTMDENGRVTSFNVEAERIVGLRRDQVIGSDLEGVLPGLRDVLSTAGEESQRTRIRMLFVNQRGNSLHLGIGSYVLRDSSGHPTGQVVIFQDVSDVVEMEKDLKRSERLAAIGELSASIAHEIRNPLAAISGAIQLMARGAEEDTDDAKKLTQIVEREVERLNLLITDFLQFARPGIARPEEIRVQGVVDEVLEMYEATRPENICVEEEIDTGTDAYADPAQLRQILWNLLLNASQAMPEGGTLKIVAHAVLPGPQGLDSADRLETVEKPVWTEIAVFDQGVGMPADIVDRVFDPFFTTKPGGTGLGLATVHRIIQDHGGSVRIERAGDGWETVVRIRIPRARTA